MGVPTNFPEGVSNALESDLFGSFGALDPSKYYCFFDDFFRYTASTVVSADWLEIEYGNPTAAIANAPGGRLDVTTESAGGSGYVAQWKGGRADPIPVDIMDFVPGKQAWFKTRFSMSAVPDWFVFIGLYNLTPDPLSGIVNGVTLFNPSGFTDLVLQVAKAGVYQQFKIGDLAPNVTVDAGWHWDGADKLDAFVNGVIVKSVPAAQLPITPGTFVTPSFALQNGGAVSSTLSLDYIFAAFER